MLDLLVLDFFYMIILYLLLSALVVVEAIRNDKNLNSSNNLKFPCSICNKNVLNTKNQYNVIHVTYGAVKCDDTS